MSQRTGMFFDIITDYKDKGTKAAIKDLNSLSGLASQITKKFVGLFAIEKLATFSKDAVQAFADESKQAAIFAQTVTGLGFAMQESGIVEYLNKISESTGILKDQLEPAFASLLRYTRNVAQSQKLFNLALDVSAGTGKSLQEVSNALGRAYLGNYAALVRLGAGITTTNAKLRTFQGNVDYLASAFSGDAQAAANSFAGSLDRLKITFHEFTVEIGAGFAAAWASLGEAFNHATGGLNLFKAAGDGVFNLLHGIARGVVATKDVFSTLNPKYWLHPDQFQAKVAADLAKVDKTFNSYKQQSLGISQQQFKVNTNLATLSAKELAAQKSLTAEKKKQLELQKSKAILDQAAKVLNLDQAEVVAAMMNESLSQNEMLRLQLKKSLLDDNAKSAATFAQELIASQIAALQLAQANPFGQMNLDIMSAVSALQDLAAALAALAEIPVVLPPTFANLPDIYSQIGMTPAQLSAHTGAYTGIQWYPPSGSSAGVTVTVIDATTGGVNYITQDNSLNGTPATVSRVNPFGAGFNS